MYGKLVIFLMLPQHLQNFVWHHSDSSHVAVFTSTYESILVDFHLNSVNGYHCLNRAWLALDPINEVLGVVSLINQDRVFRGGADQILPTFDGEDVVKFLICAIRNGV